MKIKHVILLLHIFLLPSYVIIGQARNFPDTIAVDSLFNVNIKVDTLIRLDTLSEYLTRTQLPEITYPATPSSEVENIFSASQNKVTKISKSTAVVSTEIPDVNFTQQEDLERLSNIQNEIQQIPKGDIANLNEINEATEISNELNHVQSIQSKIEGTSEGINAIKQGDLSIDSNGLEQKAEDQITQLADINGLQSTTGEFQKVTEIQETYQSKAKQFQNRSFMKQQMAEKLGKMSSERMAKNSEVLQSAHEEMSKYKKKYNSVQSIKDLPKRKPNAMKGKPFRERIWVGLYAQAHRSPQSAIDFMPAAGYKLSGIFILGIGGTYRIGIDNSDDYPSFTNDQAVFGYRSFLQARWKKGYALHLEVERMNTPIPRQSTTILAETNRKWVTGVMTGIMKRYKLGRSIKGNVQALVNLLHESMVSPYSRRFMVRFGIELGFKKKKTRPMQSFSE